MNIEINDIENRLINFNDIREILHLVTSTAIKNYVLDFNYSLSLEIIDSQTMKSINLQHRSINKDTDVLSFPIFEDLRSNPEQIQSLPLVELGDIFISWDKVINQAREFNISHFDELIHLYIHGLLHLLGFDHEISANEEVLMKNCEKMLLGVVSEYLSS